MKLNLNREFYRDLFTQELYQRRLNRYRLHDEKEIRNALEIHGMLEKKGKIPICDLSQIGRVRRSGLTEVDLTLYPPGNLYGLKDYSSHGNSVSAEPDTFTNEYLANYFISIAGEVLQLMKEFPGKVFIAGGSLYGIFRTGEINYAGDIDVFICEKSARAAENILYRGMQIFKGSHKTLQKLEVSKMVTTVWSSTTFTKIQFIRRLYPEGRPDMIIGAFDLHPCQIFWSLETGVRCTTGALVSLITQAFPLDLSRRSFSYGDRLKKYIHTKFCDLALPGIDANNPVKCFGKFDLRNGYREVFEHARGGLYFFSTTGGHSTDYEFDPAEEEESPLDKTIEPEFHRNSKVLLREGDNVLISLRDYGDFCTERIDFPSAVLGGYKDYKNIERFSAEKFRGLFKDPNLYGEFLLAKYVHMDFHRAEAIWRQNVEQITSYLSRFYGKGNDPSQYWKIDDPGSQGFGQNFPQPVSPRDYYKEGYVPIYAGIPHHTYWIIKNIAQTFFLPKDIFKMICFYTFKAEAELAYDNLGLFTN